MILREGTDCVIQLSSCFSAFRPYNTFNTNSCPFGLPYQRLQAGKNNELSVNFSFLNNSLIAVFKKWNFSCLISVEVNL